LQGAEDCLKRHEAEDEAISVYYVPGSFEIPVVAKRLSGKKDIDAVICLGAVIRGGTPHFDYVAAEVSKGIANVSLESEKPVIYGVLTTDTIEQALERAGTKAGNRGWDAAMSAMEMVNLFDEIDR
jgi:6,7-dimethyl-8-ribityllumazine synthase